MEISTKTQRLTLQINSAFFSPLRTAATMGSDQGMDPDVKVDLSSGGSATGEILRHMKDIPDTREDKIAALKQRIALGMYRVSGERIAANLLTETEENNKILKQMGIDG